MDWAETPLPKAVELLWGLGGAGSRGPRRGLSLDQIVDAAIAVADEDGLTALSMSRVAERLGFTTMSLYRYVDSKDMLIALVSDRVVGVPPRIPAATPWREALREWAWAEFREIGKHPWWLEIPMSGPPMGPNNMAWLEAGLGALASTPVPDQLKLQLVLNLSLYVIGRARFYREFAGESEYPEFTAVLGRVLDPQRYPNLARALSSQAFDSDDIDWNEADFGFSLDRLLDGYALLVTEFTGAA